MSCSRRWVSVVVICDGARTLGVGEVHGETCVDGLEEEGCVSGAGCVEHAVRKVERVGWERRRARLCHPGGKMSRGLT